MTRARFFDFVVGVPLIGLLSLFTKKNADAPRSVKKVLIIKLAAAGDSVLLIAVLKKFRERHPEAEIHWLTSPVNSAIATLSRDVDRFFVWNKKVGLGLLALIGKLREENYDVVVDLEQWSRGSALIAYFVGAPYRLGFTVPKQFRSGVFNHAVEKHFEDHEINDFVRVLSILGPLKPVQKLELPVDTTGKDELSGLFEKLRFDVGKKPWIVIHPGCGHDGTPREWPLVSYATLAHWIQKKYGGTLFLTSGPEELRKTADLQRLISGHAVNLGGHLSWNMLIALISEADMIISGNTGVMHIAAAFQKKQVALHGPTNANLWGPINPNAIVVKSQCPHCPCLKLGFEYHSLDSSCMEKISVDDVKEAVSSLFDFSSRILIEGKNGERK